MKYLLILTISLISSAAFAQMQVDKKIEMTGASSSEKKIEGIEEVVNDADAANKVYVDTAIANRASSGGGASTWNTYAIACTTTIDIGGTVRVHPGECGSTSKVTGTGYYTEIGDMVYFNGTINILNPCAARYGNTWYHWQEISLDLPVPPTNDNHALISGPYMSNPNSTCCPSLYETSLDVVNGKVIFGRGQAGNTYFLRFPNNADYRFDYNFSVIYQK